MLTCALSDKLYVAYDTQTCTLRRAWAGGVLFTGGVYDTRHGPQPTSIGPPYFNVRTDATAWSTFSTGDLETAMAESKHPKYLGYRVGKNDVTLEYAVDMPGGRVTIEESPDVRQTADRVTLVRTFTIKGLPGGTGLVLNLEAEPNDPSAEQAIESDATPAIATLERAPATAPSSAPASTSATALRFARDGVVRLTTTWSLR